MFLGCFQGDGFSTTAKTKEELDKIMFGYIKTKYPESEEIGYLITEIDENGFSHRKVKSD